MTDGEGRGWLVTHSCMVQGEGGGRESSHIQFNCCNVLAVLDLVGVWETGFLALV